MTATVAVAVAVVVTAVTVLLIQAGIGTPYYSMILIRCNYLVSHKLRVLIILFYRILVTGDFIFSSSYDKTVKAWIFDTAEMVITMTLQSW